MLALDLHLIGENPIAALDQPPPGEPGQLLEKSAQLPEQSAQPLEDHLPPPQVMDAVNGKKMDAVPMITAIGLKQFVKIAQEHGPQYQIQNLLT